MTIPGSAGPVGLVESLPAPSLPERLDRHLRRARRLRLGAPVALTDGAGRWQPHALTAEGAEPIGDVVDDGGGRPALAVGLCATKGERPAWAIQKLTELGVGRILIVEADRSVVRWDDGALAFDRLRRVAVEAVEQSRRVWVPEIDGPVRLESLLVAGGVSGGVVLADGAGRPMGPDDADSLILVGPEGGWSDAERAAAEAAGVPTITVGNGVLRTETAAVAVAAVAAHVQRAFR
ncbi:MAG TPA: RsmE family RNA methyltransferase [Acidimicrobiales bacterium]